MFKYLWAFFITGNLLCMNHNWEIINTETLKPLKMKDIRKLLPKLSADQSIDFDRVTFITYKCSICLEFRQKKLMGKVNSGT